jgi:hypothetical protein
MCASRVTRQMSRRYSHSRQTFSSMSCMTFAIAVLMRSPSSGSVFGSGETSQEDHDVQITVGTRVEPLHRANSRTHLLRSVGEAAISFQHWFTLFPRDRSSDYRTIPLRSQCVIDTNFTILRHFLLKLWRNEIFR